MENCNFQDKVDKAIGVPSVRAPMLGADSISIRPGLKFVAVWTSPVEITHKKIIFDWQKYLLVV
jgi:hypothetical protein